MPSKLLQASIYLQGYDHPGGELEQNGQHDDVR
jgi:hypothetical protein